MAFSIKAWLDRFGSGGSFDQPTDTGATPTTPVDAAGLRDMETRLSDYTDTREAAEVSARNTAIGSHATAEASARTSAIAAAIAAQGDLATQAELDAHVNDTTAAHAASAIAVSPAVGGDATVQAVLTTHETRLDSAQSGSGSGLPANVLTKTANFTAAAGDFILANATGGAFQITLPAGTAGDLITVKKTDGSANAVAVDVTAGGTIDGDAAGASITSQQFGAVFECSAAGAWQIVGVTSAGGANGADGAAGADGRTVLTTSGAPSNGTGANGDYAYDPTAKIMYGPKASGTWPAGVSLAGTNGTNGTNGAISQIQDEGSNLTVRSTISFEGAGVTAADSGSKTVVTIPGGGGGGGATDIGPTPGLHGLLGWSFDPIMVTTNTVVPLDELLGVKINLPGGVTPISNIVVYCEAAASGNTYGRFGIFNSAGTLLARTADASNLTTGLKTLALTAESGQSLPAGGAGVWIKVAMLFKGGTGPGLSANTSFNQAYAMNMNLSGTAGRYTSSYPTAPSTIPATDNSNNTAAGRCFWVGVS